MSRKIIWSPDALNDLSGILDYLNNKWSKKVVNDFITIVDNNVSQICLTPDLFPFVSREFNVRKSVVTKHNTFFFSYNDETITLLRLYDTRQDPSKIKLF